MSNRMSKLTRRLMTMTVILVSTVALNAFADGGTIAPATTMNPAGSEKHHHHHGGFFLGVCVGQKLATAKPPVILQPGKHDPAVKAQIEQAKEACKAEFQAAHPGSGS